MTDQELRDLVAANSIAISELSAEVKLISAEVKQVSAEVKLVSAEVKQVSTELRKITADLSKEVKQVTRQMGELGNKFGSFTEGMSVASVGKLLSKYFGVGDVAKGVKRKDKATDNWMEMDFFGYENSDVNKAVIVEVKSHLRESDIPKIHKLVQNFKKFYPEHANKQLNVVVAYVAYDRNDVLQQALDEGFYLATIQEELFKFKTPKGYVGKDFNAQ